LQETLYWLDTAKACGYLTDEVFTGLDETAQSVGKQLGSMINQYESFCF
jgi:four helix bundle protein